jgi:glycopeptide antibiotics resistance protein
MLYWIIYYQPISYVVVVGIIAIPIWTFVTCFVRKYIGVKANVWLNRVSVVIAIMAIMYCTLYGRKVWKSRMVELRPLYSFVNAKTQPDIYRSLIMNVILFLPFGMTLPFALPNGFKNKVAITVGSAAVISIVVEFIQFCFGLGLCETDDVIMNTLGAAIGTVSYMMYEKFNNSGVRR